MVQPDSVILPAVGWKAQLQEDIGLRRIVLHHYDEDAAQVLRYLLFVGLDRESAQDAVQETFLKLHHHLLSGGDRSNLRAWLYRVAHNLARSSQSSFRAKRVDPLPEREAGRNFEAAELSPEERLLAEERQRQLKQGIAQLSRAQRECVILRSQGLKYREIAEVLQLSVSSVGENIQRALDRLKELV